MRNFQLAMFGRVHLQLMVHVFSQTCWFTISLSLDLFWGATCFFYTLRILFVLRFRDYPTPTFLFFSDGIGTLHPIGSLGIGFHGRFNLSNVPKSLGERMCKGSICARRAMATDDWIYSDLTRPHSKRITR